MQSTPLTKRQLHTTHVGTASTVKGLWYTDSPILRPDGYAMLMIPNKGETTVHGYHHPGDIAVRMHELLASRGLVYVCPLLWVCLVVFAVTQIRVTPETPTPRMPWENCHEVPAKSSHMCCVELPLKGVLSTRLGSKRSLLAVFFKIMMMKIFMTKMKVMIMNILLK